MVKTIKHVLILACLVIILLLPYLVFAQDNPTAPLKALHDIREDTGYAAANETTISSMIGTIVNSFLSLLGIIFITLMLYAGYNWMIAAGDEAKLTKAKETIRRAIIGLVIVIGAFAIYNFILFSFI